MKWIAGKKQSILMKMNLLIKKWKFSSQPFWCSRFLCISWCFLAGFLNPQRMYTEKSCPKMLVIFQLSRHDGTSMACCSKAALSSFTPDWRIIGGRWNHRGSLGWPCFFCWENREILMKIYEICWVYNNLYCCIVSVCVLLLEFSASTFPVENLPSRYVVV